VLTDVEHSSGLDGGRPLVPPPSLVSAVEAYVHANLLGRSLDAELEIRATLPLGLDEPAESSDGLLVASVQLPPPITAVHLEPSPRPSGLLRVVKRFRAARDPTLGCARTPVPAVHDEPVASEDSSASIPNRAPHRSLQELEVMTLELVDLGRLGPEPARQGCFGVRGSVFTVHRRAIRDREAPARDGC
jgi:hypothetical protein